MLLEFSAKNYKSFDEPFSFMMTPAPKQSDLAYSVIDRKYEGDKKTVKALSSAVIYGPNAAGKSNIISAMDVLKRIVEVGHIRDDEQYLTRNYAAATLELIPNVKQGKAKPVFFRIRFHDAGYVFDYEVSIALGRFLDMDYRRQIITEKLSVNEHIVFSRNEKRIRFENLDYINNQWIKHFNEAKATLLSLAESSMKDDELFLSNGFRAYISSELSEIIENWFAKKFLVVYRADNCRAINAPDNIQKRSVFMDEYIDEASRIFGISSNSLGYTYDERDQEPKLVSVLNITNKRYHVPAEMFESYGTIRFVAILPLIIEALTTGGTLVIDEFDAALHPIALMSIINTFHNDTINKEGAQLIFNTHNPIFLKGNLFRRDEIKFVERSEETGNSVHYALSDFGTAGEKGVRKGEDYMKNYFINRYGAIREVDFSSLFERVVENRKVQLKGSKLVKEL